MRATNHKMRRGQDGGTRPLLLVHGFASHPACLAPLARSLGKTLGRTVVRVALSPGREDLRRSAGVLGNLLGELAAQPGFEHADVVAHSMGGLTATYLLKKLDRGRHLRRVVTLGTPHRGTPLALLGLPAATVCRSILQMLPGSGLLGELAALEIPTASELVSIAGSADWLVPARFTRVAPGPGQHNLTLRGVCHTGLLTGGDTLVRVAQELARPAQAQHVERRSFYSSRGPGDRQMTGRNELDSLAA